MYKSKSMLIGVSLLVSASSAHAITEICNINKSADQIAVLEIEVKEKVPLWEKILVGIYDGVKVLTKCDEAVDTEGVASFGCIKAVGTLVKDQVKDAGQIIYNRTDVLPAYSGDMNKCSSFGDNAAIMNIGMVKVGKGDDAHNLYTLAHSGALAYQGGWPKNLRADKFFPHAWADKNGATFWLDINRTVPWTEHIALYTKDTYINWGHDSDGIYRLYYEPKPSNWSNPPFQRIPPLK